MRPSRNRSVQRWCLAQDPAVEVSTLHRLAASAQLAARDACPSAFAFLSGVTRPTEIAKNKAQRRKSRIESTPLDGRSQVSEGLAGKDVFEALLDFEWYVPVIERDEPSETRSGFKELCWMSCMCENCVRTQACASYGCGVVF